jgi:hypothetical protein
MIYTPRLTPARLKWLRMLAVREQSRAQLGHSPVGYQCMQMGWTEWADIRNSNVERLTDQGRAVLAQAEKSNG